MSKIKEADKSEKISAGKANDRGAGVLMPVSSIPSEYGIGAFSKEAYEFVDNLKEAGQKYWQILPLGPTSYGDSPYQSFSTFAGNPYFIDPETLIKKGYITKKECDTYNFGKKADKVNYAALYNSRFKLLKTAFKNSGVEKNKKFKAFESENKLWLEDYSLYMALKFYFDGKAWTEWQEDLRLRKKDALAEYKEKLKEEIKFHKFIQFEFNEEWQELKAYANKKGISVIGDLPIYVALDSSDTWSSPELFKLDENMEPVVVAGCPPDAFSADGQLWGNPIYNWEHHKKTGYDWWLRRLKHCLTLCDVLRIDHFRGFDEYYAIPYPAENAKKGKWEKGPGFELFKIVNKELGEADIIAEDLGFLTPSVLRLVKRTGYPGMKVLQFAFDSREESDYLPHNYDKNSIVYTGTHDNDTILGWYDSINNHDRRFAGEYLDFPKDIKRSDIPWKLIRAAYASVSKIAVVPMQDILSLDGGARMNMPSTLGGNWEWRMKKGAFNKARMKRLFKLTKMYGRL